MPSLKEIRQFNDSFVRLADEPSVVSGWGEEVEALPEPDEGIDTDLSSLLEDTGDLSDSLTGDIDADLPSDEADEAAPDFADLIRDDEADNSAEAPTPDSDIPEAPEFDESTAFEPAAEEAIPESPDEPLPAGDIEDPFASIDEPFGSTDDPFGVGSTDDTAGAPEENDSAAGETAGTADETPALPDEPADQLPPDTVLPSDDADHPADDADPFEVADDLFGDAESPAGEPAAEEPASGDEFEGIDASFDEDIFGTDAFAPEGDTFSPEGESADSSLDSAAPDAPDFPGSEDLGEFGDFADLGDGADLGEPGDGEPTAAPEEPADPFGADVPDDFGETDFTTDTAFTDAPATDAPVQEDEPAGEAAFGGVDDGDFSDFEALLTDTDDESAIEEGPAGGEFDTDDFGGFGESPAFEEPGEPDGTETPAFDAGADDDALSSFDGDLAAFEFSDEDDVPEPAAPTENDFSFDEPVVPGEEPPGSEPESGETFDDADDLAEVSDLEELDTSGIDEFSLGDFGAEFGVLGEEGPATEEDLNPALSVTGIDTGPVAAGAGTFQLSDSEFESFQATLSALPLNLRREVAQIITEAKGTTDQVEELIRRIAGGESPPDIAGYAGRITGRQIRIPRGYEKRSGLEFEQERQSFAYQFRENILPILRLVGAIALILVLVGLAGYHLVFRPLYGRSLYRQGLAYIGEDQYGLGNQTFLRAREVWAANRWFYSYAEAFVAERQYTLAAEKYEQLLFGMSPQEREFFNQLLANRQFGSIVLEREPEKQGILDYANLESEIIGNYERADLLLQLILYEDSTDYDAGLAIGDNYMRWARTDENRYEDARIAYAKLIERYGQQTVLLFRMLTYFVRTDNLEEVVFLKNQFQANNRIEIDPVRYTEMAGYLMDQGVLVDIEDVLFRVLETDPLLPELHYELARYYRLSGVDGSEEIALQRAREYLEAAEPRTARIRRMLVDTYARIGENFYENEFYVEAQEAFTAAIEHYEEGVRRRALAPDPMFGRAYAGLADIFFYEGRQFDLALRNYSLAEEAGFTSGDLDYKQGFVLYRNGQMNSALAEFRSAARDPSSNTKALLWATGNTYYERGNYYASEAYYREILERVEADRDNIRTLLVAEDEYHQSVIEYLIRVNNNLGVTLSQQFVSSGDPDLYSTALVYLTESIEYSDNYRRDPATMSRSSAVDLAYLNQRELLYPTPEYSLQIYGQIPEDLDDLLF